MVPVFKPLGGATDGEDGPTGAPWSGLVSVWLLEVQGREGKGSEGKVFELC